MSDRLTNLTAGLLLLIVFLLCFFGMKDDSATMDEMSHIPAGYSYLTQKDFRINMEHPPLIKDLAAVPLLFLDLNFPEDHTSWTQGTNEQWTFGSQFLYYSGNNPDQILFWARIPMILLLIFLGWFLFRWTKELAGNKIALLVLTLFSFSPTFLAHGRLVTTDVAATLGVVLSSYFWIKFLKSPTKKNIILASLIFGVSMLLKFSLVLIIPLFAVITIVYAFLWKKPLLKYIGMAVIAGIIGMILIWPVYQFHLLNYPAERQLQDSEIILSSGGINTLESICIWMADKPGLRPYAHYFLGLLMASQRVSGGNTVYFLNEISNRGWWYYFPVVYLLKIPLAFHILFLIALLYVFWLIIIKRPFWQNVFHRTKECIKNHFTEFSMIIFLAIYWFTSITGALNIGVRHILPVFPFTYILVSLGISKWIKRMSNTSWKKMGISLVSVLLGFYIISSISVWPHYLTYFNEIAKGPKNGYKYAVDSNYDWGQDLKRLKKWVDENEIEKIYLNYFGGGNPEYYLNPVRGYKDNAEEQREQISNGVKEKYAPWWGDRNKKDLPKGSYLAVSLTLLQGGKGNPVPGFDQPTGYYLWLDDYEPIARVGNSIFIYYID